MKLEYEFPVNYQGKDEKLDEEYCDFEVYEFVHEINEKDVIAFLKENYANIQQKVCGQFAYMVKSHNELVDAVVYDLFEYLDIKALENDWIFYQFMLERCEEEAKGEFYKGDK